MRRRVCHSGPGEESPHLSGLTGRVLLLFSVILFCLSFSHSLVVLQFEGSAECWSHLVVGSVLTVPQSLFFVLVRVYMSFNLLLYEELLWLLPCFFFSQLEN